MQRILTMSSLYMVFLMIMSTSCKNEKSYSTIPMDSMLDLVIEQRHGDNFDPFTETTFDFVGFPGAIAYSENMPSLPFLLIGKGMHKKSKVAGHYIGAIKLVLDGKTKHMGIAMPVSDKYKSVSVESYNDFSAEHADVKLWITDWFTFAYKDKGLQSITWNNEIDILREFILTTN